MNILHEELEQDHEINAQYGQEIKHPLIPKSLDDVIQVVKHNPDNENAINSFIDLYDLGLKLSWSNKHQYWNERKYDSEPDPVLYELKTIEQYRAEILIDGISIDEYLFRTQRTAAVNSITVEVDGLVFDGDEQSQRRMLAAIHASEDANIISTIWRLADNTETAVTVAQIRQAHSLSIIKQGELWTRGSHNA